MDDSYLKKLCSDITLQSQKEGFFNQYVEQVESNLSEDFLSDFRKLSKDIQRLEAIWSQECVHILQIQKFSTPKSGTISEERRTEGNKAFQRNDNQKALQCYSQAVIRAPSDDENLSLSLANRSAVLFHLNEFDSCLQDISLALQNQYPKRLHYKVLDRRGQCFYQLGLLKDAKNAYCDALKALQNAGLDDSKRVNWTSDLKRKIERAQNSQNPHGQNTHKTETEQLKHEEDLFEGHSKILPKASSALCLKYSKEAGRFMSARKDIPAGKCLVRERPFCSVLLQEKRGRFCENCLKNLIAPIPCVTCSGVAFCGPECRDEASITFHKWECDYLTLFKGSGMSMNCFLALRVITERGLQYFKQIFPFILNRTKDVPSETSPHNPEDYNSFYNLTCLEEQRDWHDFFKRTLMTVFLLKFLQHTGFFSKSTISETELSEDEMLIGQLLLRHLQLIQFNAHEVSGICFDGEKTFKKCKSFFLGLAVYPTVSFFNHSCYPAVARYFDGKEMTIVSLRPLRRGEIVPENYGPIFTHTSRTERQKKMLSRYWFKCMCEACLNDWPMYNSMPNTIVLLKDETEYSTVQNLSESEAHKKRHRKGRRKRNASHKVTSESEEQSTKFNENKLPVNPLVAHKDFYLGKSLMDSFKREEAISAYVRWVDSAAHEVRLPLKDFHLAIEALRLLVGARGNYFVTSK